MRKFLKKNFLENIRGFKISYRSISNFLTKYTLSIKTSRAIFIFQKLVLNGLKRVKKFSKNLFI